MGSLVAHNNDLNLKATELRLGLPGSDESASSSVNNNNNKRSLNELAEEITPKKGIHEVDQSKHGDREEAAPAPKAHIVVWPPVRSHRKICFQQPKKSSETEQSGFYVKVSMDGAPYLRKIDLKVYKGDGELLKALENMFKLTMGEYKATNRLTRVDPPGRATLLPSQVSVRVRPNNIAQIKN